MKITRELRVWRKVKLYQPAQGRGTRAIECEFQFVVPTGDDLPDALKALGGEVADESDKGKVLEFYKRFVVDWRNMTDADNDDAGLEFNDENLQLFLDNVPDGSDALFTEISLLANGRNAAEKKR